MKALYTKLPRWQRYAIINTTDRYALKNVARSSVCWLSSSSTADDDNDNETSKASWRNSNWRRSRTSRLGERMMNDTPIIHSSQQQSNSSRNTLRQIEKSAFENMSKSLSDTMRVVKPRASNQVQHQRRPPPPSIHNNINTNHDNRNYNLNYHRKNLNHLKVGTNVNPHDDPQIIKALTKINNCKEIQHVLRVLKDYYSDYSRDVEGSNSLVPAAWKKIQSLLKDTNSQRGGRHQQSTSYHQQQQQNTSAVRYELEELFHKTLSEIHTYNPTQLSDIAQSTAHIVKHVTNRSNKSTLEGATLYNLFATKKSHTINYWNTILQLSIQEIDKYTPKQLVTISWTYATILQNRGNHTNDRSMLSNVVNVTPYFKALHASYKKRSKEFKSKHLGNILWSCMTCKVNDMSPLYIDFATEFIKRREKEQSQLQKYGRINNNNNDRLDPIILCQWVNGYAKSNELPASYEQLFESISHVAIPMMLQEDQFDSRHYANFVYAYALAKFNPRYVNNNNNNNNSNSVNSNNSGNSSTPESITLYDTVAKSIIPKLSTFTPQHLANISWSFAKMEHFTTTDMFHALSEESKHRLKEFTPQQLANLSWAFSKFPSSSNRYGDLYDYIASDIVNNRNGTTRFSSQGLAMLCTSFASVQQKNDELWNVIENDASSTSRLKQFGPIECSQISWSFATIGRSQSSSSRLFTGIEHVVLSKIGVGKFETLVLSNLVWSFSILGYGSSNFFNVIEKQCIDKFDDCTAKDKTMLALAYSRRESDNNDDEKEYPKELFDLIASSTLTNLRDYTGLDLFNIVVSFVKVGYIHKPLMEAVANELVCRPLSEFSYQDRDVVNACVGLAWAYSTVGCRSPRLLDYIATACIDKLDTLDTKEIGSLAWSFASLECYHRPFFRALAKSCEHRWDEFDESSLAKMAWALSTKSLNIPDSDDDDDNDSLIAEKIYMSEITKAAIAKCDTFTVQAISMLLWSCSARGYLHPRLFETFVPRASDLLLDARGELDDIHTSNIQSLANIAWACAVQDIVDADTLFGDAFISIITCHIDAFDDEGLCQLHQWNTWRKTIGHSATLPQNIEERCYDTFINRGVRSSNLQKDVIFELSRMGLQLEEEALTSSGYRLDVLVNIDDKQIGIEVDGPTHFIDKEPTGSTILKHRQVVNCDGIELVSIPYWEWNELKSSNDKERYLRGKLDACGEEKV